MVGWRRAHWREASIPSISVDARLRDEDQDVYQLIAGADQGPQGQTEGDATPSERTN